MCIRDRDTLALAFQECVCGDGRAHLDGTDGGFGDRVGWAKAEQVTDACDGGVGVTLGIFGEQFVGDKRAIGATGDDVGEGAATVDPEFPSHCALPFWWVDLLGKGWRLSRLRGGIQQSCVCAW